MLMHLRWHGWGTALARATGRWSASDCTPNCASGRRTTGPGDLTLWSPGWIFGHRVYRCFQIILTGHTWSRARTCLRREGGFYIYAPITADARANPSAYLSDMPSVPRERSVRTTRPAPRSRGTRGEEGREAMSGRWTRAGKGGRDEGVALLIKEAVFRDSDRTGGVHPPAERVLRPALAERSRAPPDPGSIPIPRRGPARVHGRGPPP